MLDLVGDGLTELYLTGSLGLEKLSEGYIDNQKNLPLFSLSIYVKNNFLMGICDARVGWK